MYGIDPKQIWTGCTVRDLLKARIAAGTFPLDPDKYDSELREALEQGKVYVITVELADGRYIAVVNQPIEGGGWVATHEDITERSARERELARPAPSSTRSSSNVPMPIMVKSLPETALSPRQQGGREVLRHGRARSDRQDRRMRCRIRLGRRDPREGSCNAARGPEIVYRRAYDLTPAGEARIITTTRLPVMGPDGKPQYLITVMHDLTERKRDEARIAYMAHHDPLTDLPNRAAFNQCLSGDRRSVRDIERQLWPSDASTSTASRPSTTCSARTPATPC